MINKKIQLLPQFVGGGGWNEKQISSTELIKF